VRAVSGNKEEKKNKTNEKEMAGAFQNQAGRRVRSKRGEGEGVSQSVVRKGGSSTVVAEER
jgi:hypothetical protein